ncbi:hypothetical protein [Streptomyces guryensis]|uniref:Uncharacterized protein n=1 Tax=Streptomyces guryensis TaxID=2886947 RepID=A0A9Q3VZ11_9ACTN|nr:hypothetical protein [Streptomyces guryensis]MCD9880777.1 hypothetical protein [Streptomyces guryensis]
MADEAWDVTGHRRSRTVAGLASTLLTVRPDGGLLAGEKRAGGLPPGRPTALGLA